MSSDEETGSEGRIDGSTGVRRAKLKEPGTTRTRASNASGSERRGETEGPSLGKLGEAKRSLAAAE